MNGIYIKVGIGLLWTLLVFIAGWKVEDWHYSSQRETELQAALKQQNKSMADIVTTHNQLVTHVDSLNTQTLQDQVHTQLLIQEQNDAIAKLDKKISAIHVGSCTINAGANGVLLDAYKAAFPAASPGNPKGGETP